MRGIDWNAPTWIVAGGLLLMAALVAASQLMVPDPPQRLAFPSAGDLGELEAYLDPAELDLPQSAGVPESVNIPGDPFRARAAPTWSADVREPGRSRDPGGAESAGTQAPRWNLSAIMIAGDRRIAILNDRMVRPGDSLEDGVRVQSVEPDHIIIVRADGQRRRLDLER